MIERSFDPILAKETAGLVDKNKDFDWTDWVANKNNVMAFADDDVGMATFEYPGVYNIHWFFVSRGRKALSRAKEMLDYFFSNYDVKTVRGLTPVELKGARWLARQVGLTSYGIVEFPDGPYEIFCMTKDEFYKGKS